MNVKSGLISLIVTVAPAIALAQGNAVGENSGQSGAQAPHRFLAMVAQDNRAEIISGLMAEQKATNPAVRAYARLLVDDHAAVESDLAQLAQAQSLKLPAGMNEQGRQTMEQLRGLSGAEFDRQFIQNEIKTNSDGMPQFQNAANSETNPGIATYAKLAMAVQQQHLDLAKAVQAQLGGGQGSQKQG